MQRTTEQTKKPTKNRCRKSGTTLQYSVFKNLQLSFYTPLVTLPLSTTSLFCILLVRHAFGLILSFESARKKIRARDVTRKLHKKSKNLPNSVDFQSKRQPIFSISCSINLLIFSLT